MRTTLTGTVCIVLVIVSSFMTLQAQKVDNSKSSLYNSDVEGQFDYIIRESSKYQEYRVVKNAWLYRIKANILDTLGAIQTELDSAYQQISRKDRQVDSLFAGLEKTRADLATATKEKNSLSFFGIYMHKNSYNSIMWTLTIAFSIALLIFIVIYKRSHSVTARTKAELLETRDALETQKKRSLDREQKITRGLYDEILKYKKKCGELQ